MAPAAQAAKYLFICVATLAALATASAAKSGLIGTGSASYCDPTATQAFARWGDTAYYARVQNGSFEGGSTPWALGGGARVVSGNEPFFISGNRSDNRSLLLPAGSSAVSGTACFALGDWHLRFLLVESGTGSPSTLGSLRAATIGRGTEPGLVLPS